MSRIQLERSKPSAFAPAPKAVRAGDYVYTSTIYPIDNNGHAIMNDEKLGEAGPSLIEVQSSFRRLQK
jgi:enamine deaminase RidA (YjgF/YER057c/UK114 family)